MSDQQPPTTAVATRRKKAEASGGLAEVTPGFGNLASFELTQRIASAFSNSTLVPAVYRAQKELKEYGKVVGYEPNPNAISNCIIAINMAQRMTADPLMVMQNLYIVEGRPSWSAQFIIAMINSCGRYSPLRFEFGPLGEPREVSFEATEWVDNKRHTVTKKVMVRDQTCRAWAIELSTQEKLLGPTVSIQMAIDEKWLTKNGSKWQTMPDVMLHYRAASFFGKLYAPELLMGIPEQHEVIDLSPNDYSVVSEAPAAQPRLEGGTAGLKQALSNGQAQRPAESAATAPVATESATQHPSAHPDPAAEPTQTTTSTGPKRRAAPVQQSGGDDSGFGAE